jgi:hypothetical protein
MHLVWKLSSFWIHVFSVASEKYLQTMLNVHEALLACASGEQLKFSGMKV